MTPVADPPLTTPHESDRIDTDTAMAVPPNLPDSPRAMANAVLAEAHRTVQIRLSQQEATNHPDSPPNDSLVETRENATTSPETTIQHDSTMAGNKYRKRHRDLLDNDKGPDTDKGLSTLQQQAKARLASLWSANTNCNEGDNRSGSNNNDNVDRDEAIEQTKQLVLEQIEQLVRQGLQLYHRQENQARELARYQEENDYKERELKRLRQSEAQSRDTITVSWYFIGKWGNSCICMYIERERDDDDDVVDGSWSPKSWNLAVRAFFGSLWTHFKSCFVCFDTGP